MITQADELDRRSGVVGFVGSLGIALRSIDAEAPLALGTVVLLDLGTVTAEEAGYFKEERRWVVVKDLGDRVILAQVTTQDTLANNGLPGLQVQLNGGRYEGFDQQGATIHSSNVREFNKTQLRGTVGRLKPDDCLAVLGCLDAGLGIGTGRQGSKGPGSEHSRGRRGSIWRNRRAGMEMMMVSCHRYSQGDGVPQAMVPVVRCDCIEGVPEDAVKVSDARGVSYWAYPGQIRMLPPQLLRGAWTSPGPGDYLCEESIQVLDGALYDYFELARHPGLKRPDPEKKGFSLREQQGIDAMDVSGRFRAVPEVARGPDKTQVTAMRRRA